MKIDNLIKTYGLSVYITGENNWQTPVFKAFIQPLRYKNKLYMLGNITPIGKNPNNVYLYIGPSSHDLTKLDRTYQIHDYQNNIYVIDRAERIIVKENVVYIWAVIRKTTEAEE